MSSFSISEMYTLELKWQNTLYEKDNMCLLKGAYFAGPALSNAEQIGSNNFMMLDFQKQYPIIVRGAYVAKFTWGEVIYNSNGTVTLKDAKIEHDKISRVPKLKSSDYIVIDTEDHESKTHVFHLTYTSYVVNEDHVMYNFMKGK